jgi:hypothetical protein
MRGPARLVAEFAVRYGTKDEMLEGRGTDVSEKGIGFKGKKIFPEGTSLEVKFSIDSGSAEWFTAQGVVRDVSEERMGVEFVEMLETERMQLLKAIYRESASRHRG